MNHPPCHITIRFVRGGGSCYIGVQTFARHPSSFKHAAGAAYGISNHVARRLETEDLFLLLMEYSQRFQRLRGHEALNTIHEDAFIGYFVRYRMNCNINNTVRYRHNKRVNCTKQVTMLVAT